MELPDTAKKDCKRLNNCDGSSKEISSTIHLPEELVYDIFLNLPVKSLIRFRCLSKSIRGMIDSLDYVKKFNHRSLKILSKSDRLLLGVSLGSDNPNLAVVKEEIDVDSLLEDMCFIGCFEGIYCFGKKSSVEETYTLWQKSTCTYRKVTAYPGNAAAVSFDFGYGKRVLLRFKGEKCLQVFLCESSYPWGFKEQFEESYIVNVLRWLWANPQGYAYSFHATKSLYPPLGCKKVLPPSVP